MTSGERLAWRQGALLFRDAASTEKINRRWPSQARVTHETDVIYLLRRKLLWAFPRKSRDASRCSHGNWRFTAFPFFHNPSLLVNANKSFAAVCLIFFVCWHRHETAADGFMAILCAGVTTILTICTNQYDCWLGFVHGIEEYWLLQQQQKIVYHLPFSVPFNEH